MAPPLFYAERCWNDGFISTVQQGSLQVNITTRRLTAQVEEEHCRHGAVL